MPLLDWLNKKQAVTAADNWLIQGDNLEALVTGSFHHKRKVGRSNYYLPLTALPTGEGFQG